MADYRIESDGTVVVYLSEMEALEAEGFTFEGKEYLTAA